MKKPRSKKDGTHQPETAAPRPKKSRFSKENGQIIGLGFAGAVLSIIVAFPPLSPVFTTAPIVLPLVRRLRAGRYDAATGAAIRWAVTVFMTILVSSAFVYDRTLSSYPFAADTARITGQALAGAGGPATGFLYILAGTIAFVLLSAASMGIAACLLGSIALGMAAASAAALFAGGSNVILVSVIALSPWQWAVFASGATALVPAAALGGRTLYKKHGKEIDREWMKRRAITAGGLFLLALILRLVLAGPYLSLARHWMAG